MTTDADVQTIRLALRDWHGYVWRYRYGGLAGKLDQAQAALEALERMEGRLEDRQMRLWDESPK